MIEYLEKIDQQLLLLVNGANSPFLDEFMWIVSGKITWAPLYLILFYFVFKKYSLKHAIWFSIFGFAAIAIGDSTATYLFKYNFARYRPSHHLFLEELLHFYEIKPGDLYKGGQYGFISGHATNSSIIATMFTLQLKKFYKPIGILLGIWVLLIVYSRIYLGVHYPSDVIAGIFWGTLIACVLHFLYRKLILKGIPTNSQESTA
ncbi:MAG: phosphatase PAP2 family protein [Brumimicrobium sp.]